MSVTFVEYQHWLEDTANDPYRILLIEAGYSDRYRGLGHGRSNFFATLNPVQSLTVDAYSNDLVEIQFAQPTSQEGYNWSIWIEDSEGQLTASIESDGVTSETVFSREEVTPITTAGGVYSFTAVPGVTYQIAVASERDDDYSVPWIANFTHTSERLTISGESGNWQDIGIGEGDLSTGTLHLASDAWISNESDVYNDFLTADPIIEYSLDDFEGIGDFKAVNLIGDLDWRLLYWRGHRCKFLHGDTRWERSDFWSVGTTLIEDVRPVGGNEYQFDLMDAAQQLRRQYENPPKTYSTNFFHTLFNVTDEVGLSQFQYRSIGSRLNYETFVELQENTQIESLVRQFVESINARIRFDQVGNIEIFLIDSESVVLTLTDDDILDGEIEVIESIPAYRRVVIELSNGAGQVEAITDAATAGVAETVTYRSVISSENDANLVLAELVDYHSRAHSVWRLGVARLAGLLQVGDTISINHEELSDRGHIRRIIREPTTNYARVEVEI